MNGNQNKTRIMQCPQCNWQNPASHTQCFSCHAPLPAPAAPRAAHANVPVIPGIWSRLAASGADAATMIAAMFAFAWATSLSYQALREQPCPQALTLAAGLLGLLLPALMDAWGAGSPGKLLFKQRVVKRDGQSPGLLRSLWRHLMKFPLNLALPGVFHHIQQAMFGERAMHNWAAGTYVVSSRADPRAILAAVSQTRSITGAGKFLLFAAGAVVLVLAGFVLAALTLGPRDADNPVVADVRHLDRVSQPVRMLAENHYRGTGRFAATLQDLGVTRESLASSGFSNLELNPVNGVLRFTIAGPADANDASPLAGKHLVYLPELRAERKGGGIRRWQCGSDDIAVSDRHYGCRHAAGAAAP
ncbi:hypothetical protein LMG3328_00447 [Achromobacter ruhlandii]|uniref:RDD domain-containing protein n=1 Tax=Achromobacter ruhlandii TaxID=72557 RepID=A0A6S7CC97_9BURK|nr:hypothetical protein LMG3328_00447 [Achromobacter ruhlandii]